MRCLAGQADVLANVTFSAGVKFMLADYVSLFGTAEGALLQHWAHKEGWPLLWTLGYPHGTQFPGGGGGGPHRPPPVDREDRRLLDLSHLLNATDSDAAASESAAARGAAWMRQQQGTMTIAHNLSAINASAAAAFATHWRNLSATRQQFNNHSAGPPGSRHNGGGPPLDWRGLWRGLERSLPRAAFLYPLTVASCDDVDMCIGTTSEDGDCACSSTAAAAAAAAAAIDTL